MPRVIRLDLQFHITNYYKKLITNYLQMCEKLDKIEKASVRKTAFMTFSSDTWQDVRVSPFPNERSLISGVEAVHEGDEYYQQLSYRLHQLWVYICW